MELFTASLKQPEVVHPKEDVDTQGESGVSGYCEFCWGWDMLKNLVVIHDLKRPHVHSLGHQVCADQTIEDWEYCTC